MIPQEFLSKKAQFLNDEELYSLIYTSLLQACRMIAPTTKPEHVRIIYDSCLPAIRKFYNDFTINNLATCFEAGSYGFYGPYAKINGALIITWLMRKREEIFREEEENERKEINKTRNEKHLLSYNNGGNACLLGLFYHENKMPEVPFEVRMNLIELNGTCPNTKKPVLDIIKNYLSK